MHGSNKRRGLAEMLQRLCAWSLHSLHGHYKRRRHRPDRYKSKGRETIRRPDPE